MVGLTLGDVPAMVVVKRASEYQVKVPDVQADADNVELAPKHIAAGLAVALVGAVGVGVTVSFTDLTPPLQTPV